MEQLKGFPYVGLVEKFLKAGYVENGEFFSTNQGTPQGGLLSPLLANIALHGLENCLNISYYPSCARGDGARRTQDRDPRDEAHDSRAQPRRSRPRATVRNAPDTP